MKRELREWGVYTLYESNLLDDINDKWSAIEFLEAVETNVDFISCAEDNYESFEKCKNLLLTPFEKYNEDQYDVDSFDESKEPDDDDDEDDIIKGLGKEAEYNEIINELKRKKQKTKNAIIFFFKI